MGCMNLDMTIDGVLADPLIGAAMRADRVDAKRLELMLRATASRLEATRRPAVPPEAVGLRLRRAAQGFIASW